MDIIKTLLVSIITFINSFSGSVAPSLHVTQQKQPAQVVQATPTAPAENADTSRNWAGYTATDGTFTGVSGTWTIPQIDGTNNYGVDAAWVGIGGKDSHDLIQAGTQETVSRNGNVSYQAFFETLPDISHPLNISVKGGDSVTVSLKQKSTGMWELAFKNNTTGESITNDQAYDSSLSSADWIEEAPSSPRRIMPLDNFGSIQFTNATTVKDGQTVNLAEANAQAIHMGAPNQQALATTSVLGNDGASFNVTRNNNTDSSSIAQDQQLRVVYLPRRFARRPFRVYRFDF